jgi:hypothetical protein
MAAPTQQDNSMIVEPFMVASQEEKKEIDLIFEPTVSLWLLTMLLRYRFRGFFSFSGAFYSLCRND